LPTECRTGFAPCTSDARCGDSFNASPSATARWDPARLACRILAHHVRSWDQSAQPLSKGQRTTLRYQQDARPRGVVQDRRASQIYRLERTADCGIREARRRSSAHLIDRGAPTSPRCKNSSGDHRYADSRSGNAEPMIRCRRNAGQRARRVDGTWPRAGVDLHGPFAGEVIFQ
jgi:hypothetical protein